MANLLDINNLKVEFDLGGQSISAVDGVDLSIRNNEIVVLAGESGSGKTISALSVTKILPKNAKLTSGSIIFNGVDLSGLRESELVKVRGQEIAYIFQEPVSYLNPVYTIGNQIMEAIMLHNDKPKEEAYYVALDLLRLVRIKDPERVMYDYPHQLSGGMNQRAFIAMALALKPKLLIADEPTTSLDVTIESQILDLLVNLKKEFGFSLLFITHNLAIARKIADRVYIMYKGKIVESGQTERIFNSPVHFHTKELIRAYQLIGRL
ncbi:MAG: ABC transporter ATP-binding protein [Candidatus Omnitrophica bacterium]|nr:ABC transporter ATP-binding protein [Candidatus Omnitrophota bacterium]